jgi:PAS domain S-box-containing protein
MILKMNGPVGMVLEIIKNVGIYGINLPSHPLHHDRNFSRKKLQEAMDMISDACLSKGRRKDRKKSPSNREADHQSNIIASKEHHQDNISKLKQEIALDDHEIPGEELDNTMSEMACELEKIKNDLRSHKELLDHTQELSRTGSFELELSNGTMQGSEMFFEIFGIEKDKDISIEMILSYIHPDDFERMDEFINSIFKGKQTQNIEFRFVKPKELMELFLLIKTVTIPSFNMKGKKVIGVVQEITAYKVAENALLESNIELAGLKGEMMEREMRVLEMKAEVNQLCRELGMEQRYSNFGN